MVRGRQIIRLAGGRATHFVREADVPTSSVAVVRQDGVLQLRRWQRRLRDPLGSGTELGSGRTPTRGSSPRPRGGNIRVWPALGRTAMPPFAICECRTSSVLAKRPVAAALLRNQTTRRCAATRVVCSCGRSCPEWCTDLVHSPVAARRRPTPVPVGGSR
jgi:hypothetical protein